MAIVATDIHHRFSGGSTNTDPNASLGGVESSNQFASPGSLHGLFDPVTSSESSAGKTEYRGIYIHNNHGTLTLVDARVFFSTASSQVDMGVAAEAVDTTMATIANEGTAPTGITFTHPTTYAGGLQLNGATGLGPGSRRGLWFRRTIAASTAAESNHTESYTVQGDTAG